MSRVKEERAVAAKDTVEGVYEDVEVLELGDGKHGLIVIPTVFDPASGKFKLQTQPNILVDGDLTVTMGDLEKIGTNSYWKDRRMEWNGDDLIYKAYHTSTDANQGDTNWYIYKYTWSSGDLIRLQGPAVGSWTNRASLF
jgi:hypothetical protein